MSTGFSSMDFSGSARRSLKDYFCGRCPAFSSASCFNSPTDWFDMFSTATSQSYPAHNHITSHGVAVVSTYFNIVGQDSDESLVYKDGFHQFLQAQTIRMFVATCIF